MRLNELKRATMLVCLSLGLSGCYRGEHAVRLGDETHPPLPSGSTVTVLFNKDPGQEFHEFAIYQRPINVGDTGGLTKYIEFVRHQASELGSSTISVMEENTARKSVLTTHFLFASAQLTPLERMRALTALHNQGAITDEEYAGRRSQILHPATP